MANKAKIAYGSLANLSAALQSGVIDAFDILCLRDEDVARIGWVDKNGNPVLVDVPGDDVLLVEALPETGKTGVIYIVGEVVYIWNGSKFISISESTDVSDIRERLTSLEALAAAMDSRIEDKLDVKEANAKYLQKKYDVTNTPKGTLINYGEKEIRIMVPENTEWVKQNVGPTGNSNMYYMGFKAYAPEGAVSFKEGDRGVILDEMFTFDDDFAGTDEFGRNYSICWLALASYNASSDTWTYFGKNSSTEKYIGWDYVVEWYDENGTILDFNQIRINLSNEECHFAVEPYYMVNVTAEIKKYVDEQVQEISEIPVVEF